MLLVKLFWEAHSLEGEGPTQSDPPNPIERQNDLISPIFALSYSPDPAEYKRQG